ncbi:hypothetical protein DFP72DRAFT_872672, partial [Ephemerocybe angulata]
MGFKATDDFAAGYEILESGKLAAFISRSRVYCERLREHGYGDKETTSSAVDLAEELTDELEELEDQEIDAPRLRMVSVEGALYVMETPN